MSMAPVAGAQGIDRGSHPNQREDRALQGPLRTWISYVGFVRGISLLCTTLCLPAAQCTASIHS